MNLSGQQTDAVTQHKARAGVDSFSPVDKLGVSFLLGRALVESFTAA